MDRFGTFDSAEVLARGETKMTIRIAAGLQVDLRVRAGRVVGARCSTLPVRRGTTWSSAG